MTTPHIRLGRAALAALACAISGSSLAVPVAAADPVPRPLPLPPGGTRLSESDRLSLDAASAACRNGDKDSFVAAFATSAAVRRRYSAPIVATSLRQVTPTYRVLRQARVPAASYGDFPIRMVDHYFKPAKPVRPGDKDEYVLLDINQSQSNQLSVEWTRVHFDGRTEGGDDLGRAFMLDGKPYVSGGVRTDGQLLFEPAAGCWRLVSDIRHKHGG
ncbi:MAG: hypothetical protein J0M19_01545 [Sphingomonadales bacterium]|nr:hypothetical protein [Sphingomonadales bacterium]